jgi:hypothetical protein
MINEVIKDGSRVIGVYGNNAIIGKVLTSRYYGAKLLYTVALDTPLSFRWRDNPVSVALLSDNDIMEAPLR